MEDRTRTFHSRQDIYLRRGPGDRSFECQLPPEVRVKLEAPPPRSTPRPPARIPETQEEIAQALGWLKSQGYLRPAIPAPLLVPPPSPAPAIPVSQTPSPAKRSHIPAVIGTVAIAVLFLYAVSRPGGLQLLRCSRKADRAFPGAGQWRFAGRSRRR